MIGKQQLARLWRLLQRWREPAVWCVHCPTYGEVDNLPEEIWCTEALAEARAHELNDRYIAGVDPYKITRMPLRGI